MSNFWVIFPLSVLTLAAAQFGLPEHLHVSNFDDRCARCLCQAATGCNLTLTCNNGYCGPFKIAKVYWVDTGRLVNHPEDDAKRPNAFEDCALHFECAVQMVKNYMIKFGRDCNFNGVTDCHDFLMIHFNGGFSCHQSLERDDNGLQWLQRFEKCWST